MSKAQDLRRRLAGTAWVAEKNELWYGRNRFLFQENGDLLARWPWGECRGKWEVREISGYAQLFFKFHNEDDDRPHSVLMHNGEMTIIHDIASKTYERIDPSDFESVNADSRIADEPATHYQAED